eukprot:5947237-Amphidinium_carterae.1
MIYSQLRGVFVDVDVVELDVLGDKVHELVDTDVVEEKFDELEEVLGNVDVELVVRDVAV